MDEARAFDHSAGDNSAKQTPQARAFVVERFVLNHLLRMARQMNGDFESLIILSVLRLQGAAHALTKGSELPVSAPASKELLPDRVLQQDGLRSSDLSQVTGVPRETVRRKLERLQMAGHVERAPDGRWHATAKRQSVDLSQDAVDQLRATADLLAALPAERRSLD